MPAGFMITKKKNLTLYHGSTCKVDVPRLVGSNRYKDFGRGFYLTSDKVQASDFARDRVDRDGGVPWLNLYKLESFEGLSVLEFPEANRDWFEFILQARVGRISWCKADVVIGKVADDGTYKVFKKFESGVYSEAADMIPGVTAIDLAVKALKTDALKNQLCFRTEKALRALRFSKAFRL